MKVAGFIVEDRGERSIGWGKRARTYRRFMAIRGGIEIYDLYRKAGPSGILSSNWEVICVMCKGSGLDLISGEIEGVSAIRCRRCRGVGVRDISGFIRDFLLEKWHAKESTA